MSVIYPVKLPPFPPNSNLLSVVFIQVFELTACLTDQLEFVVHGKAHGPTLPFLGKGVVSLADAANGKTSFAKYVLLFIILLHLKNRSISLQL